MNTVRQVKHIGLVIGFVAIMAAACSGPAAPTKDLQNIVDETMQALESMSSTAQSESSPQPSEVQTEEPVETPTAEVIHISQPQEPAGAPAFITDRSSSDFAEERRTIGDAFVANLYERPFTSEEMLYLGHIDIIWADIGTDDLWFYVTLEVEKEPPGDRQVIYGVEIDADRDGRGEWLIAGAAPTGGDWTTDRVRVYYDGNGDVGGETPLRLDEPDPALDGYEELVFDSGQGDDPDLAWIRRVTGEGYRVQVAFKKDLLGTAPGFLWGGWAFGADLHPGWFDYNDHFTQEEAGDPAISSTYYPLKALAAVDNTCRWAYGFSPAGTEPGICAVTPPTPGPRMGFRVCFVFGATQVCQCADIPTCGSPLSPCTPCTLP